MTRAFNEIVRLESPIQHFSRVATRNVEVGEGVTIPAGARVIVSVTDAWLLMFVIAMIIACFV